MQPFKINTIEGDEQAGAMTEVDYLTMLPRFRELDSCAVSDALDSLGIDGRVVQGLTPFGMRGTVAGIAITVLLGPARSTSSERHLCAGAFDRGDPR